MPSKEELEKEVQQFMEGEEDEPLYVPLEVRQQEAVKSALASDPRKQKSKSSTQNNNKETQDSRSKRSLLDEAFELKRQKKDIGTHKDKDEEEKELLERLNARAPMIPVKMKAKGTTFQEPLERGWKPPSHVSNVPTEELEETRKQLRIQYNGDDVPPLCERFEDMRLPKPIVDDMKSNGIIEPTPIQMQAIPAILSGRDLIGIAFTGSGKTLAFALPMILFALDEEMKMKLVEGEGPLGLILCPSRELAKQTYDVIVHYTELLWKAGYPQLRTMLCMGGVNMRDQYATLKQGPHMVVATPGRLLDMLEKKKFTLDFCDYFVMDEADRMMDEGFEEDVRQVIDFFQNQRQTVLFSATMPKKIINFAASGMIKPIIVNVGRAGAANFNVVQEVEYVKQENKIVYLLECLQKTPPPVVIFCENKNDVDDIHEYLLLKGVEAVAIHGAKSQDDRLEGMANFKSQKVDVLVATDVASKGLDFPDVQHVINFDMPKEIENYVHRIGRTGRRGKTGHATTFINSNQTESILLDLKHLLIEAGQKVPPILNTIHDPLEEAKKRAKKNGEEHKGGCPYCMGLGHSLTDCPKLAADNAKQFGRARGGGDGGMGEM